MWKMWRGSELMRLIDQGARTGVYMTIEEVIGESKSQVPLDEGTLRDTGVAVMDPSGKPAGCATFGGGPGTGHPVVPYAIRWHEQNANFQHGRKRFYLRDPLNKIVKKKLPENIALATANILK